MEYKESDVNILSSPVPHCGHVHMARSAGVLASLVFVNGDYHPDDSTVTHFCHQSARVAYRAFSAIVRAKNNDRSVTLPKICSK
jgi:hypothetical protein